MSQSINELLCPDMTTQISAEINLSIPRCHDKTTEGTTSEVLILQRNQ